MKLNKTVAYSFATYLDKSIKYGILNKNSLRILFKKTNAFILRKLSRFQLTMNFSTNSRYAYFIYFEDITGSSVY